MKIGMVHRESHEGRRMRRYQRNKEGRQAGKTKKDCNRIIADEERNTGKIAEGKRA